MFFSTKLLMGIALGCICLLIAPVAAQQEKQSIVVIHTDGPNGPASGYGVAAQQPDNIVTALHVVAGKSKILVSWGGHKMPATIMKINKEADLALLQLQKPLGIPPLKVRQADLPSDGRIDFWEVPAFGTPRVDRKETRIDARKKAIPLGRFDNRIIQDPQILLKALCPDGYPSLNTSVLKFEEQNIGKSHSGSPLTYKGEIVGMVDGGGIPQSTVWAIPASGNFEKLFGSSPPPRLQQCSSERLYGGLRADNPFLTDYPELKTIADAIANSKKQPFVVRDDSNDKLSFTLVDRAPFRVFYEGMTAADQKHIRSILDGEESFHGERVRLEDLLDQSIDILEDDASGVALAVPTGSTMNLKSSNGHAYVQVFGADPEVEMTVSVQTTDSKKGAEAAKQSFEEHIVSDGRKWEQEENEADEYEDNSLANDPDEPYSTQLIDRVAYGPNNAIVADLVATLTIDETDFLGIAIKVNDWDEMSKEHRAYCYLMDACAIMSDFDFH